MIFYTYFCLKKETHCISLLFWIFILDTYQGIDKYSKSSLPIQNRNFLKFKSSKPDGKTRCLSNRRELAATLPGPCLHPICNGVTYAGEGVR